MADIIAMIIDLIGEENGGWVKAKADFCFFLLFSNADFRWGGI